MRTIEIKENDGGQRLDKFLSKRFKTMPKSLMYKYIRTKYIKLNGKKCDKADFLKAGDVLTLYIKDEFFEDNPEKNYEFLKAPDKLDIVYEDDLVLAFYDIDPINEGHVLIIPKEHYLDADEMPDELLARLDSRTRKDYAADLAALERHDRLCHRKIGLARSRGAYAEHDGVVLDRVNILFLSEGLCLYRLSLDVDRDNIRAELFEVDAPVLLLHGDRVHYLLLVDMLAV